MKLRDLEYLVALADCGGFGQAAQKCYVSQPTLSMQIKKLEEQLGAPLIERNRKTSLLTPAGQAIVERARSILLEVKQINEIATNAREPNTGIIKLGLIPTLGPYLLPHIVPRISQQYPKLQLHLIEAQTHTLLKRLDDGELDVVILSSTKNEPTFFNQPLFAENFLLAVPAKHPFAKRKTVSQKDLLQQKLLLLEEGHCLRGQALELCEGTGAAEQIEYRASSLETLRHMVAANAGITLLPQLACQPNYAFNNITYIPFAGIPPKRQINMLWRASSIKNELFKQMAEDIKKITETNLNSLRVRGIVE